MEGYVAFLDLLGFSKLVRGDDFGQKVDRYFKVVRESIAAHASDLEFTVASDSTILTTTGASLNHLRVLLPNQSALPASSMNSA